MGVRECSQEDYEVVYRDAGVKGKWMRLAGKSVIVSAERVGNAYVVSFRMADAAEALPVKAATETQEVFRKLFREPSR